MFRSFKIFQTSIHGVSWVLWVNKRLWNGIFRLKGFRTELNIGVQSVPKWEKMAEHDLK